MKTIIMLAILAVAALPGCKRKPQEPTPKPVAKEPAKEPAKPPVK